MRTTTLPPPLYSRTGEVEEGEEEEKGEEEVYTDVGKASSKTVLSRQVGL